ncbi:MAG: hypothetical protein IJX69_02785 [Oscillospiraceae bacterium]|nr:hypothetical protein [Oscillospiraceae bacterium]
MFGYVTANMTELSKAQQDRYGGVYCGICRSIKAQASQTARLGLSYDMAFLALLMMSLYEPEELTGPNRCPWHPKRRNWIENKFVRYGADMNVALAYYNCLDDWQDDGKPGAKWLAGVFGKTLPEIEGRYPRQCRAISDCITALSALENANCPNPDEPANCFGRLMGEILVWQEDLWAPILRQMGFHLGRFIYLADAAVDYRRDKHKGKYNPLIAMGSGDDWPRWEEYLVLAMGRCTREYEKLPLVQDKEILDNILYSGVWGNFRGMRKKAEEET